MPKIYARINPAYLKLGASSDTPVGSDTPANSQLGFTLIEMMIALTLGLLITAAVIQVFLVSSRTSVIQSSGSQIIDANIFGLQNIENKIKLTNLGMASEANSDSLGGGVIVGESNIMDVRHSDGSNVNIALMTRGTDDTPVGSAVNNQWTGATNTNKLSDQLTVQYRAPQDMTDCEGQQALGPRNVTKNEATKFIDGQVIIERYFLRTDANGNLVLACDAARYMNQENIKADAKQDALPSNSISKFDKDGDGFYKINSINGLGDAGSVMIPNVDDFQVLLGVLTPDGIQYVTSTYYIDSNNKVEDPKSTPTQIPIGKKPIVAIKLSIIARGSVSLPGVEEGQKVFEILGENTTLKDTADKNLIRKSYESNITLRNARVIPD